MTATTRPRHITPAELAARPSARLLDVRTPAEFESEHIAGSVNLPLDVLGPHAADLAGLDGLVLVCRSGNRAEQAARTLASAAVDAAVLRGGLDAWTADGHDVRRGRSHWAMERQVRLTAGSVVLASVLASLRFPRARFAAGAIGAGLTFSAVTDTCAMARVLGRLPYNRPGSASPRAALRALR